MKALILIILPAFLFIGCGNMETNKDTAQNILQSMNENGATTDEELNSVSEDLLEEPVEMAETSDSSIMMKIGGAELLIDFVKNLTGDPQQTAMVINGVEVTTQVAADPQSFQALIASLVTSQLQGIDIFGVPLAGLVQAGISLINGDADKADFSNLFGILIRGAFNTFLSGTPYGAIFNAIAGPILDNALGTDPAASNGATNSGSNTNNSNANNNSGGSVISTIVSAVGGALTASNPLLGGILSLITNLFK